MSALPRDAQAAAAAPRIVVFADLDDTLFTSIRKHAAGAADLRPAAQLEDGAVISYTDAGQRAILDWLHAGALVVPVTARSRAAYARVLIRFHAPAIIAHGAILLDEHGVADPEWNARIAALLAPHAAPLQAACDLLVAAIAARGLDAWARVVEEDGRALYVCAKHRAGDAAALAALGDEVLRPWARTMPGFDVHGNDNLLLLLPPGLDKAPAVQFLMQRLRAQLGAIVTLGIADSHSDSAFLALCDYAATPRRTQLGRHWLGPHA